MAKRRKRGKIFEQVCELRRKDPPLSVAEIARIVGRSRERVRQILTEGGFSTARVPDPRRRCRICGTRKHYPLKRGFCISCFSSPRWITLSCPVCGESFSRRFSHIKYQISKRGYNNFFCSRTCFGKWLGIRFGFGVHRKGRGTTVMVTLSCEHCGKEFQRPERLIRFAHHFCSRRCILLWLHDLRKKRREKGGGYEDNQTDKTPISTASIGQSSGINSSL